MSTTLSDKFRNEISWNGYRSDILKSGLQKYIRRGIIHKALYCAGELDLFKEAPTRGETIRTNFLHRLMIIFLEDVVNLSIFNDIYELIDKLFIERENKNRDKTKEEEWISKVVSLLSLSQKARICSHIRAIFNYKYIPILSSYPSIEMLWKEINQNELFISSFSSKLEFMCNMFRKYLSQKNILCIYYAFQIHLSDEKLQKKVLKSAKPVWFIFEELKNKINEDILTKFINWYKNHLGTVKEGFMCWLVPLLSYLNIIPNGKYPEDEKYDDTWTKNRKFEKIEIDEYVVDRHTRNGHSKNLVEFAVNGAFVSNEANFISPLWKKFYEDGKRFEENQPILGENQIKIIRKKPRIINDVPVKRMKPKINTICEEDKEYDLIVRTQLNTGSSKTDVYFAKDLSGKIVVVKGPYHDRNQIDILVRNTEWKKRNNLQYIPFEIKQMIPNRWLEGIPLGIRNKIDRNQLAWFIVFESILEETQLKTKLHSSKIWPETEVVDWSKVDLHFDYKDKELTEMEHIDYIHALLYRYVRGIPDLADRNFLMVNNHVISIDEEFEFHTVKLQSELKKNKTEYIHNWLQNNYHKLSIQNWIVNDNEYEKERMSIIKNKVSCLELFSN